ncbi:metal-dependent hydrolase [Sphingomonas sp. HDW15A]|uniref:metal-dependent hydrolase n=1 Tax=Sphingomonas sp. HDW15A TaxID=2714942 RepID=UPI00140B4D24|nr:metal-dependent hydrolase [Sphingomonas sp. HDW15A]QIK95497.1 metal-dependent hydrolase [Sphingomonas sp. HDW15A]
MDNLTHSLAGWALGQAGLKSTTRKGLAALILGANMPDIDVFFGGFAWEPLETHRGFTHSIFGVAVLPPVLFGLLLLLDRWQVSRGAVFQSGLELHKGWLFALSYLGALTHPLLDLQTTYAVQLFSPLSGLWYHADSLFIIDVWVWSALSLAIAWSRKAQAKGREWRTLPQYALGAVLVYVAFNFGLSDTAKSRVMARSANADAVFASPEPVLSWHRQLAWREDGKYYFAFFSPLGGLGPTHGPIFPNMDHPLVEEARQRDPEMRRFLRWSVIPFAWASRERCAVRLSIGDARYLDPENGSRLKRDTLLPRPCQPAPPAR